MRPRSVWTPSSRFARLGRGLGLVGRGHGLRGCTSALDVYRVSAFFVLAEGPAGDLDFWGAATKVCWPTEFGRWIVLFVRFVHLRGDSACGVIID